MEYSLAKLLQERKKLNSIEESISTHISVTNSVQL